MSKWDRVNKFLKDHGHEVGDGWEHQDIATGVMDVMDVVIEIIEKVEKKWLIK